MAADDNRKVPDFYYISDSDLNNDNLLMVVSDPTTGRLYRPTVLQMKGLFGEGGGGGGTSTLFALSGSNTATGNVTGNLNNNYLHIEGVSSFVVSGNKTTTNYVAGSGGAAPQFIRNFDGEHDGLMIASLSENPTAIEVLLNVDGVQTPVIFSYLNVSGGNVIYQAPASSGTSVTVISYTITNTSDIQLSVPSTTYDTLLNDIVVFDGNSLKRTNINILTSENIDGTPVANGDYLYYDTDTNKILVQSGFFTSGSTTGAGGLATDVTLTSQAYVLDFSSSIPSLAIHIDVTEPRAGNVLYLVFNCWAISGVVVDGNNITIDGSSLAPQPDFSDIKPGDVLSWIYVEHVVSGDTVGYWYRIK